MALFPVGTVSQAEPGGYVSYLGLLLLLAKYKCKPTDGDVTIRPK